MIFNVAIMILAAGWVLHFYVSTTVQIDRIHWIAQDGIDVTLLIKNASVSTRYKVDFNVQFNLINYIKFAFQ